jgi:hypothetical protein
MQYFYHLGHWIRRLELQYTLEDGAKEWLDVVSEIVLGRGGMRMNRLVEVLF